MRRCFSLLIVVLFPSVMAYAQWPCSASESVPISTQAGNQWNVCAAPDGGNGAFVAWQDRRDGRFEKIYVQHLNSAGATLWQQDGISLSSTPGFQYNAQIAGDGAGGVFVVWQDNRFGTDYDIFVQRLSSSGVPMWYPGGTLVCNAVGHQYNPKLVADGSGGAVLVWQDRRNDGFDIYTQRLDAGGKPLWNANGVLVCGMAGDQVYPQIVSDASGGAIIAWTDYRSIDQPADVYAQRISTSGTKLWAENGVSVCSAPNIQWNVQLAPAVKGGAIVVWQDRRAGSFDNVYAQSLTSGGVALWSPDGVRVCSSPGIQYYPQVASDARGGAYVVWQDNRTGSEYDIYAQHMSVDGSTQWGTEGRQICGAPDHQYYPVVVGDSTSVVFVWQDKRNGSDFDIYAQGCDISGNLRWDVNGVQVCDYQADQRIPAVATDGVKGAIVVWNDYRSGLGSADLYAQRLGANGKPAGGCFRSFAQDSLSLKAVRLNKGRQVIRQLPTTGNVRDSLFERGAFPDGLVLGVEREDSSLLYGWIIYTRPYYVRLAFPQHSIPRGFKTLQAQDFVGRQKNLRATRYNNRLAGEALALKLNIAASDYGLTNGEFGDLMFRDPGVPSNPLNNRTLRQVSTFIDSVLTMWRMFPNVSFTQLDTSLRNINNAFAGEIDTLSISPLLIKPTKAVFGVPYLFPSPDPPAPPPVIRSNYAREGEPEEFELMQNYPNPFNPVTTVEFSLKENAIVTLRIFNVLGQEVGALVNRDMLETGRYVFDFDGSALPSGVYFCQLVVRPIGGEEIPIVRSNKMLLLK